MEFNTQYPILSPEPNRSDSEFQNNPVSPGMSQKLTKERKKKTDRGGKWQYDDSAIMALPDFEGIISQRITYLGGSKAVAQQ